jgi:hypothetical protein
LTIVENLLVLLELFMRSLICDIVLRCEEFLEKLFCNIPVDSDEADGFGSV